MELGDPNLGAGQATGETETAKLLTLPGSKRPHASGHRFGPDLTCMECGKTWDIHQVEPTACTPRPGYAATYQQRLREDN